MLDTFARTHRSLGLIGFLLLVTLESATGQTPPVRVAVPELRSAVQGEPFGVLTLEVPLPPNRDALNSDHPPRVLVDEQMQRVFYPVVSIQTAEITEARREEPARPRIGRRGGLLDRVRNAVRGESSKRTVPVAVRIHALYKGDGPLEISLTGDIQQNIRLEPQASDSGRHTEALAGWWRAYTDSAKRKISEDDFPKLVHQYLTSTLARRLELPPVDLDPPKEETEEDSEPESQALETLALLAAIEPLRDEILEEVLNVPSANEPANLPVPAAPQWLSPQFPEVLNPTELEGIASRVPPECFYLRFGAFSNYVWFQDISERYGGDIAQAVLLRGFNYDASARMERMLAAKMTTIAKMFGDKLISDMAVIGGDLYMKEGASLGVIFQATNAGLLNAAMNADRKSVAAKNPGASLQEIVINGKPASLLSTPDNSIRSFHVSDGTYVLVTSSYSIAERFLEVAAGDVSLAATPGFQAARSWMPESNDYSVFAYFSPEFFHRLVSPQYQIELRRRLQAIAHLEIAELASQAGAAEGIAPQDLPSLKSAGLIPPWFDQRADGAQTLRSGEAWLDSMRGARGSFLPIADVELTAVTPSEAAMYQEVASFYQDQWRNMDPMTVGIRRFKAEDSDVERVALEGYIAPFVPEKYGWIARLLGEPTQVKIQLPQDDVATLQLHMRSRQGLIQSNGDYHLFAGVKDMTPPDLDDTDGLLRTVQALKATPAYIGAWPKPGLVEQLPLGIGRALANPDYAGFSRMLGGLWRWQDGSFSLLSFNRSILENAITQLGVGQVEDFAQLRFHVINLQSTQLESWVNTLWYRRGYKSSRGNSQLLDSVHQQLKVPADQCLETTQKLLDVRLQCPLGGSYEYVAEQPGRAGGWVSTAWSTVGFGTNGKPVPPADYQAPWIEWFRGGQVHMTQRPGSLAVVADIGLEMQPLSIQIPAQETAALPSMNFDLFSLPKKLFGSSDAEPPTSAKQRF